MTIVSDFPIQHNTSIGINYSRSVAWWARWYDSVGLSVLPVRSDGSKAQAIAGWRRYATRQPTAAERAAWFGPASGDGIGIVGGPASGNLVILDFEGKGRDPFGAWLAKLTDDDRHHLGRCPRVRTPGGGTHVYVRLPESAKGAKYARDAAGRCLVETRGEQHYVVAPGSPSACHPTGRVYVLDRPGWLDGRPADPVPLDVFTRWTLFAADLNEYSRPRHVVGEPARRPDPASSSNRPGDQFNALASWSSILARRGWRVCRESGATTYWTRPGKPAGVSATSGFCRGAGGNDLLYMFTTSAPPFEADTAYSKFAAYALLEHGGDFRSAARALARAGYGLRHPRPMSGKGVRS
jgi:hypothetical protein